jgi:rhodanese-related sulfurtransferase
VIQQLTVQQLKERLEEGSDIPMILDVREPWECAICSLPGATVISMREIPARVAELPRDKEIAVLCHHGVRSQRVASFLQSAGFEKLSNIVGGINAWANEIDPNMAKY